MRILVIMPTYNEAGNIENSVRKLFEFNKNVELLIVDDGSPDGTGDIAEKLSKANPKIHVLHRKSKDGLGAAYLAGFSWGKENGFDFLVEMDADGSHRPEDLAQLLQVCDEFDLVIGSRYVRGGQTQNWPFYRKWLSKGGNTYAKIMLGGGINDMTAGFRVFRTTFLDKLDLTKVNARGYSFQIEMAYLTQKNGGKVKEVPITFIERAIGTSKMSKDIVVEALLLITKMGLKRLTN